MAKRNETNTAADDATIINEAATAWAMFSEMEVAIRLGKRAGDVRTRVIRIGDFPIAAIQAFLAYGVQRKFNDALGGSDTTLDEKEKELDEMIAEFKAGNVGRKPKEAADPVQHEARILLRSKLPPEVRKKLKDKSDDEQLVALDKLIALPKNAWVLEAAKKEVARKRELAKAKAALTVDVGELDI